MQVEADLEACERHGIKPGDIVVYESTVYPGATEEFCVPIIQRLSDRLKAKNAASELKSQILDGSFRISRPVEKITLK